MFRKYRRFLIFIVLIGCFAVMMLEGCPDGPTSPSNCSSAKITSPNPNEEVSSIVVITWNPSNCVMVVQSYQTSKLIREYDNVSSGTPLNIGDPDSGITEIKIWVPGASQPSNNIFVTIVN